MAYTAKDFRDVGVRSINISCGLECAREGTDIRGSFIIDFDQFIPHKDNPTPNPVIGNSLTSTRLNHRIIEAKTLDAALEKILEIAKSFLPVNYQPYAKDV